MKDNTHTRAGVGREAANPYAVQCPPYLGERLVELVKRNARVEVDGVVGGVLANLPYAPGVDNKFITGFILDLYPGAGADGGDILGDVVALPGTERCPLGSVGEQYLVPGLERRRAHGLGQPFRFPEIADGGDGVFLGDVQRFVCHRVVHQQVRLFFGDNFADDLYAGAKRAVGVHEFGGVDGLHEAAAHVGGKVGCAEVIATTSGGFLHHPLALKRRYDFLFAS